MRDVNRLRILQDVIDRNLRPGLAAEMLGITPRHCSRLLKRYRQSGPLGMNNQSRGRTGNRLLSASLTDQALNIIRERYADFGATRIAGSTIGKLIVLETGQFRFLLILKKSSVLAGWEFVIMTI